MIFFVCAIMHTVFFLIFWFSKIYVLMTFNVVSILFYFTGGMVGHMGKMEQHGVAWIIAAYVEITAHSVICTLWLSFDTSFYLYSIVALMVAAYVLYIVCDNRTFVRLITVFSAVTLLLLFATIVYLNEFDPFITSVFHRKLKVGQIELMRAVNILFDIIATLFFSGMFIIEIHSLIGKLNIANEKLNYSAMHDALTGLYNRRSLYKLYDEIKNEGHFCVIMGDIDNFKRINDTYGHGCGDEVLKNISAVISGMSNENDIACRWGGEEFLLVTRGSKEDCLARLNEIRNRIINLRIRYSNTTIKVTMTFGFVDCMEILEHTELINPSVNIDALVQIADSRLYYGKENGKNTIVCTNVKAAEAVM